MRGQNSTYSYVIMLVLSLIAIGIMLVLVTMLSTKGSVQFYIIGGIIDISCRICINFNLYEYLWYIVNQGNSACTLSNAFVNLYTTDDILSNFRW